MTKPLAWAVVDKDGNIPFAEVTADLADFRLKACPSYHPARAPYHLIELTARNPERERAVEELREAAQACADLDVLPKPEIMRLVEALARLKELEE